MHRIACFCLFIFGMAISMVAYADRVDDYIHKQMQRQHLPGISLAVIRDGKIVKTKGYGFANMQLRVPATPETVYELCSDTKQFTAAAIMLLAQERRLSVEDVISKYVEGVPDTWKAITLRQLLTHTSGIKDYLTDALDARTRVPGPETTPENIVHMVAGLPLNFPSGEKFAYSNTNYVLLSIVVRKVCGKSFDRFLDEHVFEPLGMKATGIDRPEDIIPNRAAGYSWTGDQWSNSPYLNPSAWNNGDGGIRSTVLDLAKWDAALNGEKILTSASQEQMWTPVQLKDGTTHGYGFGWGIRTFQGHRCIGHNGGRPGASSTIARFVNDKLTVILLTNIDDVDLQTMSERVAGFYVPALAPPIYRPIKDKEPRMTERIRAILDSIVQRRFGTDILPGGVALETRGFEKPIHNQDDLSESIHSFGAVRTIALVERKDENDTRLYRYRVTYPTESLLVSCELKTDEKLVRLEFQRE